MSLTIAAAALKLTPLDFEGNRRAILDAVEEAKKDKAQIICCPELCITGYGCEDAFFYESVIDSGYKSLHSLCSSLDKNLVVIVGLPVKIKEKLYNCAAVLHDGQVKGLIPKQFLANDGVHYEKRWFEPWKGESLSVLLPDLNAGKQIPFGPEVIDVLGIKIGFEICEDAWIAERHVSHSLKDKVDLVFNPSASHFAFGKDKIRRDITIEGSKITNATHVFVNQLGNESGRTIYDGDIIVASKGKLKTICPRLSFAKHSIFTFVLNEPFPEFVDPSHEHQDFYDFTKACALGLYDYLKKSGSQGFVLSLSGGADSAAVALLVRAMIFFLVKEHGLSESARRLCGKDFISHESELCKAMLHCVYQGTSQNSDVTRKAAREVAHNLEFIFSEIELNDIVSFYQKNIEKIFGQTLNWQQHDISLQNIQSRSRAPGIWMLANLKNALLLTTGNRSEASVGYSTMDGDTSGSLSPIAGVSKVFVQQWLIWLQTNSVEGFGPFPWLKIITAQRPTAELRPLMAEQTDEKDLMPYAVLGFLEEAVLYCRLSKASAYQGLLKAFENNFTPEQLQLWTTKFYDHWKRSQWKRERLAPSFHLDRFSVDSRTWYRFPILSKGLY